VYKYIAAASRLLGTGDTVHGVSHGAGTQQDTVVEQAGRKYTRGKLQRSEERSAQLISSKGPLLPCCIADSSVHGEGGIIWSNGPDKGNTMDATLIDAHTYCIQQYS